ncbi:MAG: tetratricopeptide repeat protein [Candidatus Obscuribacterales bacterium]|nr:tetratricopeptide repeat protein [Candidatus Obscuribacterales bacterium]
MKLEFSKFALLCVALFLSRPAFASEDSDLTAAVNQSAPKLDSGDAASAEKILTPAIEKARGMHSKPEDSYLNALELLARAHAKLNNPDKQFLELNQVSTYYLMRSRKEDARSAHRRALAVALKSFPKTDLRIAQAYENCARDCEDTRNYEQAVSNYDEAIKLREKTFDANAFKNCGIRPNNYDYTIPHAQESWAYAEDLRSVGWSLDRQRLFDKGGKSFEKYFDLNRTAFGDSHEKTLEALSQLAMHYERARNFALGESTCKKLIEAQKKTLGANDQQLIFSLNTLSHLYEDQDKDADAEKVIKEQLAIAERHMGKDSGMVAGILENYYGILAHMGRAAEAKSVRERAERIRAATHTRAEHKVEASVIKK